MYLHQTTVDQRYSTSKLSQDINNNIMSNQVTLTVSKSKESSNGGYVLTLKHKSDSESVATPFGNTTKSDTLNTYYMKVEDAPENGFSAQLDLDDYTIVERPFTTESGKDLMLKWLHIN
jgi:hypothetical protein